MRLFFALWPDDALREALHRMARKPVRHAGGKPVTPDNYHVTLKFLGSTDDDGYDCVCAAADAIRAQPFELRLDQIGFWPKPRILWLGAEQVPEALTALVHDLDQAAEGCGFEPELRPYRPHVTLVRKVGKPGEPETVQPLVWRPKAFVLAASETLSQGAHYRVLRSWALTSEL
ncbi:MAG TPA: RNA 2',3'-cyclic phosphodiesterase [Gammaproteobacteria bacterium]|nr:RNA 2',3'-cyclic phosphodiesterase [Gammaproteobacteria bacterium]